MKKGKKILTNDDLMFSIESMQKCADTVKQTIEECKKIRGKRQKVMDEIDTLSKALEKKEKELEKKRTENKLVLKDLACRLPYEVYIYTEYVYKMDTTVKLSPYIYAYLETQLRYIENTEIICVKPYLRPMSSMTEEEKLHMELKFHFSYSDGVLDNVHIFETSGTYDRDGNYEPPTTYREIRNVNMVLILEFIHWLNEHHFDYRGLIEKGLALEALEGMYK